MLVIRAFGGAVAWAGEGSPVDENSDTITHQVTQILRRPGHVLFAPWPRPQLILQQYVPKYA